MGSLKSDDGRTLRGLRGLVAAWYGLASLSHTFKYVFLLSAFVLTSLYIPLTVGFMSMVSYWPNAGWPMLLLPAPWFAFALVSVFRCRRNTDVAYRGYLAVLSVPLFGVLYVWFTIEAVFNMSLP